jgi:hypothetical protein
LAIFDSYFAIDLAIFRCYISADGQDEIRRWFEQQTPGVQGAIAATIDALRRRPARWWRRKPFALLHGTACSDLGEIRLEHPKSEQYRIGGYLEPSATGFAMVDAFAKNTDPSYRLACPRPSCDAWRSNMTGDAPASGAETQSPYRMDNREFRAAYMAHGLRAYLADQIRALRGNRSQRAFGLLIGKPQSVVSRLESEDYGKLTLQTLLDIAEKLDIALVVKFADFPTFLGAVADGTPAAMAPSGYAPGSVQAVAPRDGSGDKYVSR